MVHVYRVPQGGPEGQQRPQPVEEEQEHVHPVWVFLERKRWLIFSKRRSCFVRSCAWQGEQVEIYRISLVCLFFGSDDFFFMKFFLSGIFFSPFLTFVFPTFFAYFFFFFFHVQLYFIYNNNNTNNPTKTRNTSKKWRQSCCRFFVFHPTYMWRINNL